jgi:hypothetical protein
MELKNFYTTSPMDVQNGDVFAATVTCHIRQTTSGPRFTLYRCPYPNAQLGYNDIPQGDKIFGTEKELKALCKLLFPVVINAGGKPEFGTIL